MERSYCGGFQCSEAQCLISRKKVKCMYHECKSKGYKMIYFLFWYSFFLFNSCYPEGISGGVDRQEARCKEWSNIGYSKMRNQ